MGKHVIRQGEHLASVAAAHGFANDESIWNHPDNAALKSKRASPYILQPGDEVALPERTLKKADVATGKSHRFLLNRTKLQLAVRLLDWKGEPLADAPCVLEVDGQEQELVTDGDGIVRASIPRTAKHATVTVDGEVLELAIGYLDPSDEPVGLPARLNALGYWVGDPEDVDEETLRFAIELFQYDHDLPVDGEPTLELCAAVEREYGC
jgi:hypothetical protein